MFAWIANYLPTVLICAALICVVALIIRSMVRNRRNGKSACGCSCGNCPMGDSCHKRN